MYKMNLLDLKRKFGPNCRINEWQENVPEVLKINVMSDKWSFTSLESNEVLCFLISGILSSRPVEAAAVHEVAVCAEWARRSQPHPRRPPVLTKLITHSIHIMVPTVQIQDAPWRNTRGFRTASGLNRWILKPHDLSHFAQFIIVSRFHF